VGVFQAGVPGRETATTQIGGNVPEHSLFSFIGWSPCVSGEPQDMLQVGCGWLAKSPADSAVVLGAPRTMRHQGNIEREIEIEIRSWSCRRLTGLLWGGGEPKPELLMEGLCGGPDEEQDLSPGQQEWAGTVQKRESTGLA